MKRAIQIFALLAAPVAAFAQETFEVNNEPRVRVVTNVGEFVIELNRIRAPLTVENFLGHIAEGHYNGVIFHRVVAGFIAQAGGFTPDMEQKPNDRTVNNESGNGLSNLRGTVAMARTGAPHSANSQFYINLSNNLDLNPRPSRWGYTVFGEVTEGMEVVDRIGHAPTGAAGDFDRGVPTVAIIIQSMLLLTD